MTRIALALLAGGLFAAPGLGATPDPKDLVIPAAELSKARELVRKLGSEIYREREEAYLELGKMGRLARPALVEAAATDADPEVRFRTARLLPKAGADETAARLATFLADTDGKYEHDLPGLKHFRTVVGRDEKARALFVEVVKSPHNLEMLQAVDRGTTEGGRAVADRRNDLFNLMQHRNFNGRVSPPQQPSLPDIACLMFCEAVVPGKEVPRNGMFNHVTGAMFLQQPASMNALMNGSATHSEPYKRIIGTWMETRDDPNDLNQLAHIVGQQGPLRSFPQSQTLLRRIVTTDGVAGYAQAQALMSLVQTRGKEELPFLMSQLKNETLVNTVWFGNVGGKLNQNEQHPCLLRDVAFAMVLTQTGQKLRDYGFIFQQGQGEPNGQTIGYGNYAFPSEEARAAAMVKLGFWRIKQSLRDPGKAAPAPAQPDPQPQPRPKRPLPQQPVPAPAPDR